MTQFLIEVFAPRLRRSDLVASEQRVQAATRRLSRRETRVQYLRAIYVPEDETCFYVFESPTADLVAQVSALAGLGDGRIAETFDGGSAPSERRHIKGGMT